MDLHLHTPGSNDYEQPKVTYLEWMRQAAEKDLDIVAITDHNTVAGVAAIREEVEWLMRLEGAKRLTDEEKAKLAEWRELTNKVLVLPGFEFTATFGFHILGIFPPETAVRELEHVLLTLSVPPEKLDVGSTETGASADVLTAYKVIHEAGGLAIAAHANSTHGVAMRNFPFGGQTKIAYTQNEYLDALEVTDHDKRGRSTARFFNGSKAEYPRKMHCIQGSDAHRLEVDAKNAKRLGIGERPTELRLAEPSFEAIRELLRSERFEDTRPAREKNKPYDAVAAAREEGPSATQSFHESAAKRGGRLTAILSDLCAFANTNGGSVFLGAGQKQTKAKGMKDLPEVEKSIRSEAEERIKPPLDIKFDMLESEGTTVLRAKVEKGKSRPYALDDSKFYLRDDDDTNLAVRDEIVALVREVIEEEDANDSSGGSRSRSRRGGRSRSSGSGSDGSSGGGSNNRSQSSGGSNGSGGKAQASEDAAPKGSEKSVPTTPSTKVGPDDAFYLPQDGVEVVESQKRNGYRVHSLRDLRNGRVIHNVSRKGARKLWDYAIGQHEDAPVKEKDVKWQGNIGVVREDKRAGKVRYDLALKENGDMRVFYGVTENGMDGRWAIFADEE